MKKLLLCLLALAMMHTSDAQKTKIRIETSMGDITLMLYDGTPLHRDNMIKLVTAGFYDSTLFHRVIPQFVVQGGDPDSRKARPGKALGEGDVGYRIPAEIDPQYYHKRGAIGMARDNNPKKESSGCQFYIVIGKTYDDAGLDGAQQRSGQTLTPEQRKVYKTLGGTPHLDGNYTVFGEVIDGMDVADKIAALKRDGSDRPLQDVRMIHVTILKKKKKRFLFF